MQARAGPRCSRRRRPIDAASAKPTSLPARRRERKSREVREEEILTAAFEIFGRDGFAAAKISDIAERAGVSKGTIYVYYDTKEAIFEGVIRRFIAPMVDRVEEAVIEEAPSHEAALRRAIAIAYEKLAGPEVRAVIIMLMGEGLRFPKLVDIYYEQVVSRASKLIAAVVRAGIEAGEFRDVPVEEFPQLVTGPGMMGAIWKHHFHRHAPLDLKRLQEAHVELLLSGLKADGGSPVGKRRFD